MPSAFQRLAARADRLASRAAFLAAAAIAAERAGLAVADVVRPPTPAEQAAVALSARGLAPPDAARAATARQEALYLAATVCGRSNKSLARASGLDPRAVRKALAKVEERREDAAFDRALDEVEIQLRPAAELELMGA
ncbi:MAG TPA: hypothetical protein PK857_00450 [Hyphomicrobium sp.]|nr:hypothetical protein [Hyphomicrobium sp.]HRO48790.1 hypothetical protein [Hyphomicrobium sp.]